MINKKQSFGMLLVLLLIVGCTHHYVPEADTFRLDDIHEFSSKNSITLENAQDATEEMLFASTMGHDIYANLPAWTETAIAITQRELSKRDMHIADNQSKKLKLSVNTVKGTFRPLSMRVILTLSAETGDGYIGTYTGNNQSPANINRAADGAVMRAVAEMLRDRKIVEYLIE
jgi:hypothetical protein